MEQTLIVCLLYINSILTRFSIFQVNRALEYILKNN